MLFQSCFKELLLPPLQLFELLLLLLLLPLIEEEGCTDKNRECSPCFIMLFQSCCEELLLPPLQLLE